MNKKVLVLSAVTCVAGIVTATAAGCSSSDTSSPSATPDASQDVRSERPRVDAEPEEDAGQCPLNEALTADDLLAKPGYKPGKAQPGACTTTELAQFEKNLDDTNIKTWKDLGNQLGTTCADCIITSTAKDNWGPVVYTEESGGDRGFYNFGACFGVVEGNDLCGQSVQLLEFCLDAACDTCAETAADREACIDKAADTSGMCAAFVETLQNECKQLTTSGKKCNAIADAAAAICGAPLTDGGADGGDAADANDQ